MTKTVQLHDDDLLFHDVLLELHLDFIKKSGNPAKCLPKQIVKMTKSIVNIDDYAIRYESQRNHEGKQRGPP